MGLHAEHRQVVDAAEDYTGIAKLLHWLIAAFVLGLVALGLTMTRVTDLGLKFQLYQLHKSFGITVLGLMALRIAWRLFNPPPRLPGSVPQPERLAAHGAHLGLYLLLVAMPLTGWAMTSAAAFALPISLYGLVPWPTIGAIAGLPAADKKAVEIVARTSHEWLGWTLIALATIHAAAALRHGLVLHDGVLRRMTPRLLRGGSLMLAGCLLALPRPALAADGWTLSPKSQVGFEASVAGTPVRGTFRPPAGTIVFDSARPAAARIDVTVPVAGVSTGTPEIDTALPAAEWLDATGHPEARYTANGAKPLGGGRFQLDGTLALKGRTAPLAIIFTLAEAGAGATVTGEATLDRGAFGIGPKGAFSGIAIGDQVKVTLQLGAARNP